MIMGHVGETVFSPDIIPNINRRPISGLIWVSWVDMGYDIKIAIL